MQKLKEKLNAINKKQRIILIIVLLIIASCIVTVTAQIVTQIQIKKLEGKPLLEWEEVKIEGNKCKILITVTNIEGIETIQFPDGDILKCNNKKTVGIDYEVEDRESYDFIIKVEGKPEETETVYWERPRIKGEYILKNGIYLNKPDLTGYRSEYTRYLDYDGENMVPANWIYDEEPESWYNYAESKWANIYVEAGGPEVYYVWIPRYCFKLDQENQRSDVKFIDVYNNYKDKDGNIIEWKELEKEGYQVPEGFVFNGTELPGYWIMKYTAGDNTTPSTINYDMAVTKGLITIKNTTINTNITNQNPIKRYTIAVNGKIVKTIEREEEIEDISNQLIEIETTDNLEKTINVTGLNEKGEIVGSMTKKYSPAVINPPELKEFEQDTTFYVTWDENGNEHSTIPISKPAPEEWYEYGYGEWANIVTRNNGLETYYVWIPRYEFTLDQSNQRSNVKFLTGTTEAEGGYQVPEAFTFNGNELTGYWIMKYTLSSEIAPRFDTEVVATNTSIRTKGITGTEITRISNLPEEEKINLIYNYYINGEYIGHKTSAEESYEYINLEANTKYTIQVEIRNNNTNEYLGSIVKQITTIDSNEPELIGFNTKETDDEGNKLPVTYYVLYDGEGNEKVGEKIEEDGRNMPTGWYDYSKSKWANIVVTDGEIENGEIKNATKTTYYTWIPRYEFRIDTSQYQQANVGRTEVRFLDGITRDTDNGYQIPEAFTFNGQEIPGYWIMKYTVR